MTEQTQEHHSKSRLIGWREWVGFPAWGVRVKAKVDTGAATSAICAENILEFRRGKKRWVSFDLYPYQHRNTKKRLEAEVVSRRVVKDSSANSERRYVVLVQVCMGKYSFPMELTLTSRRGLNFRMLMGRRTMVGHFCVDPCASFLQGKPNLKGPHIRLEPKTEMMTLDKHENRHSVA